VIIFFVSPYLLGDLFSLNIIANREERAIVSDIPGTTHDPVDETFLWKDKQMITLVDTAGIRRWK